MKVMKDREDIANQPLHLVRFINASSQMPDWPRRLYKSN